MNSTQTNQSHHQARTRVGHTRAVLALMTLFVLSFSAANVVAQRGFSKKYPARKNVRLQLSNLFGTVEVQTWNRDEIKVGADMYPPVAPFTPEQVGDTLVINVRNENRAGRGEVGDINFKITVPVNSSVDIETRRGNITVRGVQGAMVRAKVYGSGEIELSEIEASSVMAETITGNIFFEGRLISGGKYDFQTVKGDVTIRIPGDSAFSLVAAAPSTRKINLGMFANPSLNLGDGRKVFGNVGDGRCSLVILNQQGSITFVRR